MSDHSQAIFDRADFCGHCKMEVEIPFIVWLSPQYDNNDLTERLKNNIDTPAMTDNFIHVLADMIDLEYKYFDLTKSFINQKYIVKPRVADGEFYDK